MQAQEKVHGVAYLVGKGGYSVPKLHVWAVHEGGMNHHCEAQLATEMEKALITCSHLALTPDHLFELRLVIEHEFVCKSCYEVLIKFCKKHGVGKLNVYRPTRPSRNCKEDKLVAGSSCMRAAWGDDIVVQKIAHWPCTDGRGALRHSFKSLQAPQKPGLFFACGCNKL